MELVVFSTQSQEFYCEIGDVIEVEARHGPWLGGVHPENETRCSGEPRDVRNSAGREPVCSRQEQQCEAHPLSCKETALQRHLTDCLVGASTVDMWGCIKTHDERS